jgi:tetratricopeptide (TPR) repeat protein
MRKFSSLLFLFFLMKFSNGIAQKSAIYTNDLQEFNRALSLFTNNQYQSAQIIFDNVKTVNTNSDVQADCAYYSAICAIHLNQNGADEMMENFIKDYPTSSKQNQAYIEVAHYYFDQGKFPQALEWFDKVDESTLSYDDLDRFNFQKGYSYFSGNKKKEAVTYFNKVLNSKEYGSQAKYYLGFMAYDNDDYKNASKYFDEVSGEEKYKEKLILFPSGYEFQSRKFSKSYRFRIGGNAKIECF